MRNKLKFMAIMAALAMAAACGSDDDGETKPATDSGSTDAGATDGGSDLDAVATDSAGGSDTVSADDTATSTKMQTCTEVGDCVIKACAPVGFKKGCTDACLAPDALELSALQKAAPALSCMQDVCLAKECTDTTGDPGCLDECMNDKCLVPVLACLDDGKTGDKPCPSIGTCMDACSILKPEPFKCMNACVNSLNASAKAQLNAVTTCMADKGSMEACFMELATCMTGGKTGDKPCGFLLQCMGGCEDNEGKDDGGACMFGCLAQVTKEGQQTFGKMLADGCVGGEDGEEPSAACGKAMFQCAIEGQSGDLLCHQTFGCAQKCVQDMVKDGKKADEGMCYMQCATKLTKEAQAAWLDMSACMGKEGDAECDKKMMACIAPSGKATCAQTAACLAKCPSSGEDDGPSPCTFDCLHEAKDAAAAGGILAIGGLCEKGPTTACVNAAKTCGNASGSGTCADLMTCMQTCMSGDGDPNGAYCAIGCLPAADPKAADAFADVMICQGACEDECKDSKDDKCEDTCLGTKCKDALAACPMPK